MSVRFRFMKEADIPAGLRLCRAAGWNQVSRDWELFLALSPSGCLVAEMDGRTVGTVATVRYEDRFAWIGMVLVDPAMRGQGIGTGLLEQALELLQDIRCVKLDATPAGQPIYRKLGFEDEYVLGRMEAAACTAGAGSGGITRLHSGHMPEVFAQDRQVFGADRSRLLRWIHDAAPQYAWVKPGAGHVFGRSGHNFEHIGPIIADSQDTARGLVLACLSQLEGRRVVADVPENQREWRAWLRAAGFIEQRPLIRMFRGANLHPGRPEQLFGILGPEFG